MIEPLPYKNPSNTEIANKINELVSVVNALQAKDDEIREWVGIVSDLCKRVKNLASVGLIYGTPEPKTHTDPYAEQRKWIGKLCKFWDHLDAPKCIDILAKIDDEHLDYPFGASCTKDTENVLFFKHCEPITADDELIYKPNGNV